MSPFKINGSVLNLTYFVIDNLRHCCNTLCFEKKCTYAYLLNDHFKNAAALNVTTREIFTAIQIALATIGFSFPCTQLL